MARINPIQTLYFNRFYTGLITQRNRLAIPIRVFGRRIIELYDALIDGLNMELNQFLTLQRRPGYLTFNGNSFAGTLQNMYSFKPAGTNLCLTLFESTAGLQQASPTSGPTVLLVAKVNPVQSTFKTVGPYCYVGNPALVAQKVDQNLTVTHAGIAISEITGGLANAVASVGSVSSGPGPVSWTNPSNVTGTSGYAQAALTVVSGGSNTLQATSYGFNIPSSSQVTGIRVSGNTFASAVASNIFIVTSIMKASTSVGVTKNFSPGKVSASFSLGGPSDTWGTTFGPGDINNTGFGVAFFGVNNFQNVTFNLQNIAITVYGTGAGPTVVVSSSGGSVSAQTGWSYVFAYGSSLSGNVSNPTPPSINTGPISSKLQVTISLVASQDPQVNQIRVFRTTDGGPATQFFELPNSPFPNTTANVNDTATDSQLQVSSIINWPGINAPPPPGINGFEWFGGRLWGFVNNLLYFSSGPDIVIGNQPECWNADYVFAMPTNCVRLISLGAAGMLVFTIDEIHIVQGNSTESFTVNIWAQGIGARQYNAVDFDGTTVYVFTSDRQMLEITPSGINPIGTPIGNILDNVDPTTCYVTVHRSGSQDQFVSLADPPNGNIYTYNLLSQAWNPVQQPSFGVQATASLEITPGVWKYLIGNNGGTANNFVLQRDLNTFSDVSVPYTCFATFGNIPFADPGSLGVVEAVVTQFSAVTTKATVGALMNDISGNFLNIPNPLPEPTAVSLPTPQRSYQSFLWQLKYLDLAKFTLAMETMQLKISFGTNAGLTAQKDEILGIAFLGPLDTGGAQMPQPVIQGR